MLQGDETYRGSGHKSGQEYGSYHESLEAKGRVIAPRTQSTPRSSRARLSRLLGLGLRV